MAFVVDSTGKPSLLTPDEIPSMRGRARLAFQSYPALLIGDGEEPWELQAEGRGVDLDHRDSRLAICTLKDGSVVIALTRFSALGRRGETLPFGPTVPEMVTLMRSLGCQRALLLDGGVSSQLAVRNAKGELTRWSNWRAVPLGLVVTPRK
jgi:exopolysaccharide biosynthesis protein